jgi:hypothetical protein
MQRKTIDSLLLLQATEVAPQQSGLVRVCFSRYEVPGATDLVQQVRAELLQITQQP